MLLHMENWEIYGGNRDLWFNGVYADGGGCILTADPDGLSAGGVMRSESGPGDNCLRYVLQTLDATLGIGFRMWMGNLPAGDNPTPVVHWLNAGNGVMFSIVVMSTGRLRFYNSDLSVDYTTPLPVLTANAWYQIETKVHCNGGGSTFELRVEGVPVISLDSINLGNLPVYQICIGTHSIGAGSGYYVYWKDWFVWNGAGSHNNDFLGSCIVYSLTPNSDVAVPWTKVGGATGYGILDTVPPQDGTIYLDAPYPPPEPMTFGLTDLPPNVTSVRGIMTQIRAKKIDGGDGNLQNALISGSSTGNGADRPITAAFTYWRDIFETDPATGASWTVPATNAVKLQIDRTV